MTKVAVILFNLGGPDKPHSVKPFLFSLFFDTAIINLPKPLRWILAKFLSMKREPIAKEIYSKIGGKSPLLDQTRAQSNALEKELNKEGDTVFKVFISMRYWHPMSPETVQNVEKFDPDRIVLLPLYPQYSTTTSRSSIKDWQRETKRVGLIKSTNIVCCYPTNTKFISAQSDLLIKEIEKTKGKIRILFSAHGLPKKIIARGDPYQNQVEKTATAIARNVSLQKSQWRVCYQSRGGPLEWIGPSLDDELISASEDKVGVIILPIAFVSEHSETLVELDLEY